MLKIVAYRAQQNDLSISEAIQGLKIMVQANYVRDKALFRIIERRIYQQLNSVSEEEFSTFIKYTSLFPRHFMTRLSLKSI